MMEEVESTKQSGRMQWLLQEAGEQGFLTFDQVLEAFPQAEENLPELDDLFHALRDQGIPVRESKGTVEQEMPAGDGDQAGIVSLSGMPIDDSVGLYLAEVGRAPLLTREEEVALAEQLERGREAHRQLARNGHEVEDRDRLKRLIDEGQEAWEYLIRSNARLVVSIAKRYCELGVPFLDLIQAGNLGLIKAVEKFDYQLGYKFGTYATWWIRQAITRSLSREGRTIRIPVHMGDRVRRLYKMARMMEQDLGRRPTPEEVAEEVSGLTPDDVRWMFRIYQRPVSLDRPVDQGDDPRELGDVIEDETASSPIEEVEHHLLREELEQMLQTLSPREDRVLRLRYGLGGGRSHTLKEVGDKLGVSRERARQIARGALRKLRHPHRRRRLLNYLS
jgi:RNA polymerase primary sigma factor